MTKTATALNAYYTSIERTLADTAALYELDGAISGIPFSEADRKPIEQTRSEIAKRKEMAASLAKLAASWKQLTHLKSDTEVATAATALGNELIAVQALPSGSPVPDALGKAGSTLMELAQAREEKKAAGAIDATVKAMADLFEKEKPVYDTIFRTEVKEAAAVAKSLIAVDAVDPAPMLTPALKPFGLSASAPSAALRASLLKLMSSRADAATGQATQQEEAASTAMLKSLQEMSSRVHLLADGKPMKLRGAPLSLSTVERWAESRADALI